MSFDREKATDAQLKERKKVLARIKRLMTSMQKLLDDIEGSDDLIYSNTVYGPVWGGLRRFHRMVARYSYLINDKITPW